MLKVADAAKTLTIVCARCGGRGVDSDDTICPICFGVGTHKLKRSPTGNAICPRCQGMGRHATPDTQWAVTCVGCEGRGLVRYHTSALVHTAAG